ncbi:RidA family protein [Pusillimonas sp. CC-YST705]|uniref:RidA family protein n=1 Tax=Mesopusillimonas faecipullorum TaxID=2755040 RepID=A0ABS8CAT6_9BURK|nr:RidA family protein [Mesopusillimonas faecipullorum]MCB5363141.1 RidA family protein [Mesopusillimonas faecipullorum]
MAEPQLIRNLPAPGASVPPGATWSNCLIMGPEIVLSGMTAHPAATPDGSYLSTYEQAMRIFAKIEQHLVAAGVQRAHLYKLVIYLTNIADKDAVNQARADFFAGLQYPCSTLVGIQALVFPGLTIEIDAFARLDFRLAPSTP